MHLARPSPAQALVLASRVLCSCLQLHTQCLMSLQPMGVKSKRFMKQMLQHMKQARYIKTMKTGKGTQMGFILPENMNPQGKGVPWPLAPVSSPAADEESSQDAA